MFDRLGWRLVERRVEIALDIASGVDLDIGTIILERLRTYGEFHDRLANQRDIDIAIARGQAEAQPSPVPAQAASCTLGGLRLVARTPGSFGNAITTEVSPGTGSTFSVQGIDPTESEILLNQTIDAINGVPPALSSDQEIASIQQEAADYLANLDEASRTNAIAMTRSNWDRYRVARTSTDLEYDRDRCLADFNKNMSSIQSDTNADFQSMVNQGPASEAALLSEHLSQPVEGAFDGSVTQLTDADYDSDSLVNNPGAIDAPFTMLDSYNADIEKANAITASTFNLKITSPGVEENYNDIIPGTVYNFGESILIGSAEWVSNDRPDDGLSNFSGGVDAVTPNSGIDDIPENKYTFTIDANRTFSLPQFRSIVQSTMSQAETWLS